LAGAGAPLVLAGLWAFNSSRRARRDDLASQDWPHVEGEITKAGTISFSTSGPFYVNYKYAVAGVSYKGAEVLGDDKSGRLAIRYFVGHKGPIYYDHAKPSTARLRPSFTQRTPQQAWAFLIRFACLGLFPIGLAFLTL
jgi:Protein of unknown function (DUF3592)